MCHTIESSASVQSLDSICKAHKFPTIWLQRVRPHLWLCENYLKICSRHVLCRRPMPILQFHGEITREKKMWERKYSTVFFCSCLCCSCCSFAHNAHIHRCIHNCTHTHDGEWRDAKHSKYTRSAIRLAEIRDWNGTKSYCSNEFRFGSSVWAKVLRSDCVCAFLYNFLSFASRILYALEQTVSVCVCVFWWSVLASPLGLLFFFCPFCSRFEENRILGEPSQRWTD